MALQPKQLRQLHFRGHRATDVGEGAVPRRGDLPCFRNGAMIGPHHDIPFVAAGGRDGDRTALGVERYQRARGVEGQAGNTLRTNA